MGLPSKIKKNIPLTESKTLLFSKRLMSTIPDSKLRFDDEKL